MAKKTKSNNKLRAQNRRIIEFRPVNRNDKWCKFKSHLSMEEMRSEAPYGYLIRFKKDILKMDVNLLRIDGIIIRNRVFKGELELQIVMKDDAKREYASQIKSDKMGRKFLNIRNYNKKQGWR